MAKNGHNFKTVADFEVRSFAKVSQIYWSRLYKKIDHIRPPEEVEIRNGGFKKTIETIETIEMFN